MIQSAGMFVQTLLLETVGGVELENFMKPNPKQLLNALPMILVTSLGIVIDARL